MKTLFITLTLLVVVLASCKRKTYTCACGDMNSTERTPVFEVRGTKEKAEKKCKDYHDGQVAIPEWTCEIQ